MGNDLYLQMKGRLWKTQMKLNIIIKVIKGILCLLNHNKKKPKSIIEDAWIYGVSK